MKITIALLLLSAIALAQTSKSEPTTIGVKSFRQSFEDDLEQKIEIPYRAQLDSLNIKYSIALTEKLDKAIEQGNLDIVLEYREEVKVVLGSGQLPIICLIIFSCTHCFAEPPTQDKSLKIVKRVDRGAAFLIPVITLGFDGKQWVFSSGDFTNVTADIIFDEVKKADEIKYVTNGFGLLIPKRFTIEEASSYYVLAPKSGTYLMYAQLEGSEDEISSEQMFKEYIKVIDGSWTLEHVYEGIRKREKLQQ